MCSRIIFFIASLYVVHGSVIIINAYDGKPQTLENNEDSPTLYGCMNLECDQKCRRFGMHGGSCVEGRCRCDITRISEDFASILQEYQSLQSCNPQECDQRCRRLKFPGGACVNGRCKCDNFLNVGADEIQKFDDAVSSASLLSCYNLECDQSCRRIGFPGGVCVNDHCKCDILRTPEANEIQKLDEAVSSVSLLSCYNLECDQSCRRIGFPGGVCVNDHCKCDILRKSQDFLAFIKEHRSQQSCNPQECDRRCRRLKFPSGACVNGRCKCDNFLKSGEPTPPQKDDNNEAAELDLTLENDSEDNEILERARCYQYKCNDQCIRIGYAGGLCRKNKCKCY